MDISISNEESSEKGPQTTVATLSSSFAPPVLYRTPGMKGDALALNDLASGVVGVDG